MRPVEHDFGGVSFDLATRDAQVFGEVRGIHRFKRRILKSLVAHHHRYKVLWFVTLTYPERARPEHLYSLAYIFADYVAKRRGEGVWLFANTREKTRRPPFGFHWHGLVLTSRAPDSLLRAWTFDTAALPTATCVHLIGGQKVRSKTAKYRCPNPHLKTKKDGKLVEMADACAGKSLRDNLAGVVTYSIARDPRLDHLPLRNRVVASGLLERLWCRETGWPPAGRGFDPFAGKDPVQPPAPTSGDLARAVSPPSPQESGQGVPPGPSVLSPSTGSCPKCGLAHPPGSRKKLCDRCRPKVWRENRKGEQTQTQVENGEGAQLPTVSPLEGETESGETFGPDPE